jgi:hypothetical protein
MICMMLLLLLHDVGQKPDLARTLDGLGQLALLLGGYGGDARGHDLAAFGHEALQQAHILVVDDWRILAGEWGRTCGGGKTGGPSVALLSVTARLAVALATVTLAHHRAGAFLMRVDADGQVADDVFVDAGLALKLATTGPGPSNASST